MTRTIQHLDHSDQVIDRNAVADVLGTTERHVRRLAQTGRLPYLRVGGKQRFLRGDIADFITDCRVERDTTGAATASRTSNIVSSSRDGLVPD